jgi:excisionase family DNA binding protein
MLRYATLKFMNDEPLLTRKEAAAILKIGLRTLAKLVKEQDLPHHRIGFGKGGVRFDRQEILAWALRK